MSSVGADGLSLSARAVAPPGLGGDDLNKLPADALAGGGGGAAIGAGGGAAIGTGANPPGLASLMKLRVAGPNGAGGGGADRELSASVLRTPVAG